MTLKSKRRVKHIVAFPNKDLYLSIERLQASKQIGNRSKDLTSCRSIIEGGASKKESPCITYSNILFYLAIFMYVYDV